MRLCVTDMIGNYGSLFQLHTVTDGFPVGIISFVQALI